MNTDLWSCPQWGDGRPLLNAAVIDTCRLIVHAVAWHHGCVACLKSSMTFSAALSLYAFSMVRGNFSRTLTSMRPIPAVIARRQVCSLSPGGRRSYRHHLANSRYVAMTVPRVPGSISSFAGVHQACVLLCLISEALAPVAILPVGVCEYHVPCTFAFLCS
jgi:hypothetical protein